jgi:biotin carboxyl carrier protein
MTYEVTVDGQQYNVEVQRSDDGAQWICRVGDREFHLDAKESGRDVLSLLIEGRSYAVVRDGGLPGQQESSSLVIHGRRYAVELRDPRAFRGRAGRGRHGEGPRKLVSPMPGKLIRVLAPPGTSVEAGAGVVVIEAMKMQNEIKSPKSGVVRNITVAEGAAVNAGDVLAIVE